VSIIKISKSSLVIEIDSQVEQEAIISKSHGMLLSTADLTYVDTIDWSLDYCRISMICYNFGLN